MAVRAYPYRVTVEHVIPTPWISLDTGAEMGEHVESWDYSSVLRVQRRVEVDLTSLLSECGLPSTARAALSVRYWPVTSLIRHTAVHLPLTDPDPTGKVLAVLTAEVPGAELAGAVTLETSLVLVQAPVDAVEPFVARRPGSVLWRDERTVRLEGTAGLLPVAPVSFKEQGLPEQAAWYVSLDSADWMSAAMGSLLVLLNDDNPAVRKAVEQPDEPDSAVVLQALMIDVVCDLVGRALMDEEFPSDAVRRGRASEISTAALVQGLIGGFLSMPSESLPDAVKRLRDEWQRDPSRVRARAQSGLNFLGRRS
ncbi:hypothetical protein [Paractinoplanes brasiliensis]|uniref:Uncharacterized protein n=1 Tax=Paractinoplanes brasiliensis TaxID=52695 RepID=A0A4R6JYA4_9ACTN|nr:hypothetical protein [Actinoplanes brasiliensis]TDO39735.1 hypothetical protein C8E87_3433 [Actinoplanes brasiliensis]GID28928.1 hypothetical protein Abr02nite_39110 [Actinoplanes brasiliensis]